MLYVRVKIFIIFLISFLQINFLFASENSKMSARTTSHEEAPSSKDFGNFGHSLVDLNAQEKDYISPPQPKIG